MHLLNDSLLDVKRTLKDVLEKISLLSDEITNFVHRSDFITLQRYVEFWEPIDFVTRKEVNEFLRRKFKEDNIPINHQSTEKSQTPSTKSSTTIEEAYPDND